MVVAGKIQFGATVLVAGCGQGQLVACAGEGSTLATSKKKEKSDIYIKKKAKGRRWKQEKHTLISGSTDLRDPSEQRLRQL